MVFKMFSLDQNHIFKRGGKQIIRDKMGMRWNHKRSDVARCNFNINDFMVWNTKAGNSTRLVSHSKALKCRGNGIEDGTKKKLGLHSLNLLNSMDWDNMHSSLYFVWILHKNASHQNQTVRTTAKPTEWEKLRFSFHHTLPSEIHNFEPLLLSSFFVRVCLYMLIFRVGCVFHHPPHTCTFFHCLIFSSIQHRIYPLRFIVVLAFCDYYCL